MHHIVNCRIKFEMFLVFLADVVKNISLAGLVWLEERGLLGQNCLLQHVHATKTNWVLTMSFRLVLELQHLIKNILKIKSSIPKFHKIFICKSLWNWVVVKCYDFVNEELGRFLSNRLSSFWNSRAWAIVALCKCPKCCHCLFNRFVLEVDWCS